jgi:hypothetical protein
LTIRVNSQLYDITTHLATIVIFESDVYGVLVIRLRNHTERAIGYIARMSSQWASKSLPFPASPRGLENSGN